MKKLSILIILFFPFLVSAQGFSLKSGINNPLDTSGSDPNLGQLFNNIFFLVLALAIILAVFGIIRAGYTFMVSGDNAGKREDAKNRVVASVGGLILALGAVLILNTINPDLTNIKISFPQIQKVDLPDEYKSYDTNNDNRITYNELKGKLTPEIENYLREQIANSGLLSLNPSDLETFLPGGNTIEGWEALFHQMMLYESEFESSKTYGEKKKNGEPWLNSNGEQIISTGLLQMSYESANQANYGNLKVTTESLKDPKINIQKAIAIMEYNVRRDGSISSNSGNKGGGRYWSVLRPTSNKRNLIISGLNN